MDDLHGLRTLYELLIHQMQGYNEVGLYHDDLLQEDLRDQENDEVWEAVRRLPPDLADERSFRICRAMNLSANKQILPKAEWTTWVEDSTKGRRVTKDTSMTALRD